MKALVTGGGGFVGRQVVARLLARGDEVRTLQRSASTALDEFASENAGKLEQHRGDIADSSVVRAACEGCDVVFHIAAKVSAAGKRADFERINIQGTQNVVRACEDAGVKALVYCSTPSVVHAEGDSLDVNESAPYAERYLAEYPRTKALAEQFVLAHKGALKACALRPHLIFGEDDDSLMPRLLSRAKSGRLPIIGEGENVVDWTYVGNVADAHLLAADALMLGRASGEAYFITNGEPVNPWVWFNGILRELGAGEITRKVSLRKARTAGKVFDKVWRIFSLKGEPPMTEYGAVQVATSHTFSIDKARRDLGYDPKVSMNEATERTVKWAQGVFESL